MTSEDLGKLHKIALFFLQYFCIFPKDKSGGKLRYKQNVLVLDQLVYKKSSTKIYLTFCLAFSSFSVTFLLYRHFF